MADEIKRGDIYWIAAEEGDSVWSDEPTKCRPGVIVSNDKGNMFSSYVVVVYTTTRTKKPLATHFETDSTPVRSTVMCEDIYTIKKDRLTEYIGSLTDDEVETLNKCLAVELALDCEAKDTADVAELKKELDFYKQVYNKIIDKLVG